jgi:hypothetical protein
MNTPAPNLDRMLALGAEMAGHRGKRLALQMFSAGKNERDLLDALSEKPTTGTARRDVRPGTALMATSGPISLEARQ